MVEFGDFDVLKVEEVPTPEPQAGELLIKVLATGLNRLDDFIREGSIVPELEWPHILGADAAGEVAAVGEGVTGFTVGERVIPQPGLNGSGRLRDASGCRHGELQAARLAQSGYLCPVHLRAGALRGQGHHGPLT